MRIGEYHRAWWKAVDRLKQDGHLLFGGQEIQGGIRDEEIEAMYQRLMSPSNSAWRYCIVPRNLGTNKSQTRGSFTSRHKEISSTLWGHKHGMDKCALVVFSSSQTQKW
jgi:hypothetical protein